jgi:hypothetical protein
MPVDRGGFSFSGQKLAAVLERLVKDTAEPVPFTVDHGTEFTSISLEEWSYRRGIRLDFTRPGKPTDNGHIESFNGRLRDECLDVNQIASLEDAAEKIESWRLDYNDRHPHNSSGHLTPSEVVKLMAGKTDLRSSDFLTPTVQEWGQRHPHMTSHFTSSTESAQPQVLQLVQFESTVEATQHFGVLTTLTTFHLMASYRGCRHGT